MRINAYVLAATPDWLRASVSSYYDYVDRIIVTYDRDGLGWNQKPLEVERSLALLRGMDHAGKMTFSPGRYARDGYTPFDNQTYQRQCALDEASEDAQWVLQLDTDEVLGCADTFFQSIAAAEESEAAGLYYPSRWLYQHVKGDWYLERCSRFWRIAASYPGPVAVRAGTRLRHARQIDGERYWADFRPQITDWCYSKQTEVKKVVRLSEGIIHYAYIRSPASMNTKTANHGDLHNNKTDKKVSHWQWCGRHPYLAVVTTPAMRRFRGRPLLRFTKIKPPNDHAAAEIGSRPVPQPLENGCATVMKAG